MAHKTGLSPGTPKFVEIFYPELSTALASVSRVGAVGDSTQVLASNFASGFSPPATSRQKVIPALQRFTEPPYSILSSVKLSPSERSKFCRDYPNNALASFMLGFRTYQGQGLRERIFSSDNNREPFFQNFEFNSLSASLLFPIRAANEDHIDCPVVDDATQNIFKKNPFLRQTHRVIAAEAANKFGFRLLDKRVGVLNRIHQDKPEWLTEDGVLDRSLLLQMVESLHQLENSELALNLCHKIIEALAHYQDQDFFVGANGRFCDLRDKILKEWQPRKLEVKAPEPASSLPSTAPKLPEIVITSPEKDEEMTQAQKIKRMKKNQYQRVFIPKLVKAKPEQASAQQDKDTSNGSITLVVPDGMHEGASQNELHLQLQRELLSRADAELRSGTMLQEYLPEHEIVYDLVTPFVLKNRAYQHLDLYKEAKITRDLLNMQNLSAWQLISLLTSTEHTSSHAAKTSFGVLNRELYPLAKRMALVKELEEKSCHKGLKSTKSITKFATLRKSINVLSKYIDLLEHPSSLTYSEFNAAFNFIRFEYDKLAQKRALFKQNASIFEAVKAIRKNFISLYLAYQEKLNPCAPIWQQSYAKQQSMLVNLLDLFDTPLKTDSSHCSQVELAMIAILKAHGLPAPETVLQQGISREKSLDKAVKITHF